MIKNALGFLTAMYKVKTINRQKMKYCDRKYRDYDLFYWEKQQAEYLY